METSPPDMTVTRWDRIAPPGVIQFATGDWRRGQVEGISVSPAAYALLKPSIARVAPDWTPDARHAVTRLPTACLTDLSDDIRSLTPAEASAARMVAEVSVWLTQAADRRDDVHILGV